MGLLSRIVWLALSFFYLASATHKLNFTAPDLAPVVSGAGLPHYTVGQNITVEWVTPFKYTTLMVFQLREHTWAYEVLAINYESWETSYIWEAHAVNGTPLKGHPFHFVIENGKSYACDGCVTRGPWFNLEEKSIETKANSATTSTSSTSAARTHATHPTVAAAAGASTTRKSSPVTEKETDNSHSRDIGLGVGLGLGIPLLLAIFALVFFCLRRRRKRRERFSYHPTGSGNWTADLTEQPMRESGALGTWAQPRASQGSNPFRPSYAPSGMSRMSHKSWIDDFEFERPELRDQDAMSQLRRSIHSSNGSDHGTPPNGRATPTPSAGGSNLRDSYVPASRRSEISFANTDLSTLEGIPEQPQAVHYRQDTPDGRNWPLP